MMIKYRVHEVAKDLNVPSKDVITLLGKHFDTPKKHMTALTEEELNVVFEHFTQKNQVENFDAYFASGKKEEPVEKPSSKEEKSSAPAEKKEPAPAQPQPQKDKKPADQKPGQQNTRNPQGGRPALQQNRQQVGAASATVSEAGSTGTRGRHVDMRTSQVNLDKYNEKYDNIATSSMGNRDTGVKKQKLTQRSAQRGRPQFSRKDKEAQKMRRLEMERQRRQKLEITIPDEIQVGELAARLKVTAAEVIKRLMALGVMASVTEVIDYDTAAMVAMEIGAKVEKEVILTIEDRLIDDSEDNDENLQERSPVVVVMGHVDHGKTSLLDAIRHANVTSTEAGGITQHIGAYRVMVNDRPITFLDTPGHEAFTSMRARGAQVTDIAILVVAADDGIMPQTVEAINHAKAAGVSIIVAINKMDKDTANPDKVKQELTEYELVPEEWGGDVICVPVSAVTKQGIDTLLEMVQLVADMKELKANPDRLAKGTVIEAKLDKGRGPVATVLVQNGTLRTGDVIIAGTALGRVRVMLDDHGQHVEEAGPSVPVEITGLAEVPSAGDTFNAVEDERLARELVEQRRHEQKEEAFKSYQKVTLDNLFSQIAEGE
ncbi:MAG TPA: translation initiation factor IF-2, partial [Ruminococcaceae bacterium]|nr:translation initiation factor IF-2 [Oscillospiraceae bacterium]